MNKPPPMYEFQNVPWAQLTPTQQRAIRKSFSNWELKDLQNRRWNKVSSRFIKWNKKHRPHSFWATAPSPWNCNFR
jgi:hypothetical protein